MTVSRVQRQGTDLVPRETAPGSPEVVMRASTDRAALAKTLAYELAEAGMLVHLAEPSAPLARMYVVALGDAANPEVDTAAGRVAIAPPAPVFSRGSLQPLLLIRDPGPPSIEQTARAVWELRFKGLGEASHLTVAEEHSLIEAVVLWLRNRAVD